MLHLKVPVSHGTGVLVEVLFVSRGPLSAAESPGQLWIPAGGSASAARACPSAQDPRRLQAECSITGSPGPGTQRQIPDPQLSSIHTLPSYSDRLHTFVSITARLPTAAEPSCSASHHRPNPPGFPIRPCRPPPRVSRSASFPLLFRS